MVLLATASGAWLIARRRRRLAARATAMTFLQDDASIRSMETDDDEKTLAAHDYGGMKEKASA